MKIEVEVDVRTGEPTLESPGVHTTERTVLGQITTHLAMLGDRSFTLQRFGFALKKVSSPDVPPLPASKPHVSPPPLPATDPETAAGIAAEAEKPPPSGPPPMGGPGGS